MRIYCHQCDNSLGEKIVSPPAQPDDFSLNKSVTQVNLNRPSIRATRDSLEPGVLITQLWVLCLPEVHCGCGVVMLSSNPYGEVQWVRYPRTLFSFSLLFFFFFPLFYLNSYDHLRKSFTERQRLPFLVFKNPSWALNHLRIRVGILIDVELKIC